MARVLGINAVFHDPAAGGVTTIEDLGHRKFPEQTRREDAVTVARRVRAEGGTVVATSGCFDLLHAGHVRLLQAARSLGDALIVCLRSDRSVARLKGPGRPLVTAADRAALLHGLNSVDAVHVFDEDTPVAALEELRPHLFVKGGNYTGADSPEAEAMSHWGGEV